MADVQINGYFRGRVIEGVPKKTSVTTMRFNTPGNLDVIFTSDGTTSILQLLKQIAQQIVELTPDSPIPPEWSEIVKTPQTGTEVTLSFGIRSEFTEDE